MWNESYYKFYLLFVIHRKAYCNNKLYFALCYRSKCWDCPKFLQLGIICIMSNCKYPVGSLLARLIFWTETFNILFRMYRITNLHDLNSNITVITEPKQKSKYIYLYQSGYYSKNISRAFTSRLTRCNHTYDQIKREISNAEPTKRNRNNLHQVRSKSKDSTAQYFLESLNVIVPVI